MRRSHIVNVLAARLNPMRFPPALRYIWQKFQHPYYALKGLGRRPECVPPLTLMIDGPRSYREFIENGDEFLRYYVDLGQLKPNEKVLDVGSGMGRKTRPLVTFLNKDGSYVGMDIVKSAVDWCQQHYKKYPNFEFRQIDVRNKDYNPKGTYTAAEYEFPFSNDRFDFVVLNSVFTHMMAPEVENYVSEIARVLKPNGRCFISFFLLNDESSRLMKEHRAALYLKYEFGAARAVSRDTPEIAVGFDEGFILDLFKRNGLEIVPPIYYGSWCSRDHYLSYQDLVIARKVNRD